MKRLFRTDGRLSWPLVATVAYVTASLVVFDYVWRVVAIPFNQLLLYSLVAVGTLPILLFGLHLGIRWLRWRRNGGRRRAQGGSAGVQDQA